MNNIVHVIVLNTIVFFTFSFVSALFAFWIPFGLSFSISAFFNPDLKIFMSASHCVVFYPIACVPFFPFSLKLFSLKSAIRSSSCLHQTRANWSDQYDADRNKERKLKSTRASFLSIQHGCVVASMTGSFSPQQWNNDFPSWRQLWLRQCKWQFPLRSTVAGAGESLKTWKKLTFLFQKRVQSFFFVFSVSEKS